MADYKRLKFPRSRIATVDICSIGLKQHHIPALLEVDVTTAREKIRNYRKDKGSISFSAWLVKAISLAVKDYESVAAYPAGKRKIIVFEDVNISMIVEKEIDGQKVPIPLVIEEADKRSIESITRQITEAKEKPMDKKSIVLQKRAAKMERVYYHLPGFLRRAFWRYLLSNPGLAYSKMGNVSVTSIGMVGSINGWFIPISVHPLCFGIGSVVRKPVVINDKVEIRQILNMTVLINHDVTDGAPMARFIKQLTKNIETGIGL